MNSRTVVWTNGRKIGAPRLPELELPALAPSTRDPKPLCQTRLDRIACPTPLYHRTFFRWFLRLTGDRERYPAPEMKRYLEDDLGPEVCRLRIAVSQPEATMTGEEWERLEDALQKAQAKADAIVRVLEARSRERPSTPSRRMKLLKTPSASPGSDTTPSDWDPFENE